MTLMTMRKKIRINYQREIYIIYDFFFFIWFIFLQTTFFSVRISINKSVQESEFLDNTTTSMVKPAHVWFESSINRQTNMNPSPYLLRSFSLIQSKSMNSLIIWAESRLTFPMRSPRLYDAGRTGKTLVGAMIRTQLESAYSYSNVTLWVLCCATCYSEKA